MLKELETEANNQALQYIKHALNNCTMSTSYHVLHEIKEEKQREFQVVSARLENVIQGQLDDIERAANLLHTDSVGGSLSEAFNKMEDDCERVTKKMKDYDKVKALNTARLNILNAIQEVMYFHHVEAKCKELSEELIGGFNGLENVYEEWQQLETWRRDIQQELESSPINSSVNEKLQAILSLRNDLWRVLSGAIHQCIDLAMYDVNALKSVFSIADKMTRFLAILLNPPGNLSGEPQYSLRIEIEKAATLRLEEVFGQAEDEKGKTIEKSLNAATSLLMDLSLIKADIAEHCHPDYEILAKFSTIYNRRLEETISTHCADTQATTGEKLQLIQWIECYNSEIVQYASMKPSSVLRSLMTALLGKYLDDAKTQFEQWIQNIWDREDKASATSHNTELVTTVPEDILSVVKSHFDIAKEHIPENTLAKLMEDAMRVICDQQEKAYNRMLSNADTELEAFCSMINDTNRLQSELPQLLEHLSDSITTRRADLTECIDDASGQMINIAVLACLQIAKILFDEVQTDVLDVWFTTDWDIGEPVVENLVFTLEDYYSDLTKWIGGSFFFPKIVSECLKRASREYMERFQKRAKGILKPLEAAGIVEKDYQCLTSFFTKYLATLRREGYRTKESIEKEFAELKTLHQLLATPATNVEAFQSLSREISGKQIVKSVLSLRQDVTKAMANELLGGKPRKEGRFEHFRRRSATETTKSSTPMETTSSMNPFSKALSPAAALTSLSPKNPFLRLKSEASPRPANPFAQQPSNVDKTADSTDSVRTGTLDDFVQ